MTPKYVFLDIDGTLVGYDAKIPPSALEAMRRAKANGHKMIIATGRQRAQIYPDLLASPLFDGIVCSTGAHVECGGRCIYQSVLTRDDLCFLLDYFDRQGICYLIMTSDELYSDQAFHDIVLPYMRQVGYSEGLIRGAYGNVRVTDAPRDLGGVEKLSYFLSERTTQQMTDDLDGRFYVVDYSVGDLKTEKYFGEITLAGVTKGTAIERYMAYVGASPADTIAVGDSGNDIDMFHVAGYSVAMGNATEPIKAAADLVTRRVDDDGIYAAFEKLGLI